MTIRPYNDKIVDYFNEIDDILKQSKHNLIAIGKKTADVKELDFKSNIYLYESVKDLLNVL